MFFSSLLLLFLDFLSFSILSMLVWKLRPPFCYIITCSCFFISPCAPSDMVHRPYTLSACDPSVFPWGFSHSRPSICSHWWELLTIHALLHFPSSHVQRSICDHFPPAFRVSTDVSWWEFLWCCLKCLHLLPVFENFHWAGLGCQAGSYLMMSSLPLGAAMLVCNVVWLHRTRPGLGHSRWPAHWLLVRSGRGSPT